MNPLSLDWFLAQGKAGTLMSSLLQMGTKTIIIRDHNILIYLSGFFRDFNGEATEKSLKVGEFTFQLEENN